jgi:hypothetical protein
MNSAAKIGKRGPVIDEYGELARRVTAFKPTAERKLELEKEIASWYGEEPADREFVAEGRFYSVQVSARGLKRTIVDMTKLFAAAGKARFLQICTVPVGAIDREFPVEKRKAFLAEERTGRRNVDVVAKETAVVSRRAA